MSVLPIVLGKSAAFISVYCITLSYLLCFHYKLFGYPMNGSAGTIVLFLLPIPAVVHIPRRGPLILVPPP